MSEKMKSVEVETSRGKRTMVYGPVRVVSIRDHTFRQDGSGKPLMAQAELRQTVSTLYPSARTNSSNIQKLYNEEEFGISSNAFENERVCWINIPLGKTKQDVEKKLSEHPDATIYRIMADNVEEVLSEEQLWAIREGTFGLTLDSFKKTHVTRLRSKQNGRLCPVSAHGEWLWNSVEVDPDSPTEKITNIIDDSKFQYNSKGFSLEFQQDVDLRAEVLPPDRNEGLNEDEEIPEEVLDEATATV